LTWERLGIRKRLDTHYRKRKNEGKNNFHSRERKGLGAKGPRSESSRERIGQGAIGQFAPRSELARERKGSAVSLKADRTTAQRPHSLDDHTARLHAPRTCLITTTHR